MTKRQYSQQWACTASQIWVSSRWRPVSRRADPTAAPPGDTDCPSASQGRCRGVCCRNCLIHGEAPRSQVRQALWEGEPHGNVNSRGKASWGSTQRTGSKRPKGEAQEEMAQVSFSRKHNLCSGKWQGSEKLLGYCYGGHLFNSFNSSLTVNKPCHSAAYAALGRRRVYKTFMAAARKNSLSSKVFFSFYFKRNTYKLAKNVEN